MRFIRAAHCALCLLILVRPSSEARAQRTVLSATIDTAEVRLGASAMPTRTPPSATSRLYAALTWHSVQPGLDRTTLPLMAGALGTSVDAIIVRVDPSRFHFVLDWRTELNGMTGTWTVDSAPEAAALAVNAGQFRETGPWGWLVMNGVEERGAARAPLAASVRVDSAGALHWDTSGSALFGFQSFPLLVRDHAVPARLRDPEYVDMNHRDSRMIMAERDDGTLLFVLTRFGSLGEVAQRVPIGLTTPESLMLVWALGARNALMLDGGTSGQLMVRDHAGVITRWPGLRRVPLALYAVPRAAH